MGDEVDRHNDMVDHIVKRTGLDQEKVERILYAGEPWLEQERFAALLHKAFQYAEHTGTHPRAPLDAFISLLKLDMEYKAQEISEG